MINDEADEVIEKLFESLKNRYQKNLQSMRDSEFSLSSIMFIYCIINVIKVNPNHGESYIDSPDWMQK